jgi:hypothetical protein
MNQLNLIAHELELENFQILRMSELVGQKGELGKILTRDGKPLISVNLDQRAMNLISTVGKESIQSHMKMFGWTESESIEHTTNIAITMGLVGQAVKSASPNGILIHNEAFITRGMLNNIFNSTDNPLVVVALRDLLENKAKK